MHKSAVAVNISLLMKAVPFYLAKFLFLTGIPSSFGSKQREKILSSVEKLRLSLGANDMVLFVGLKVDADRDFRILHGQVWSLPSIYS